MSKCSRDPAGRSEFSYKIVYLLQTFNCLFAKDSIVVPLIAIFRLVDNLKLLLCLASHSVHWPICNLKPRQSKTVTITKCEILKLQQSQTLTISNLDNLKPWQSQTTPISNRDNLKPRQSQTVAPSFDIGHIKLTWISRSAGSWRATWWWP